MSHSFIVQPHTSVKKILLRLPNWLGDSVMASPLFEWLKLAYPNARFTLVGTKASCGIYERDSHVEQIIIDESKYDTTHEIKHEHGLLARFKATCELGRKIGKHDVAISLSNTFFSALMMYCTNSPLRLGYARNARSPLLSHPIKFQRNNTDGTKLHQAQLYLRLIAPLAEVQKLAKEHNKFNNTHSQDIYSFLDSKTPILIAKESSFTCNSPRIGINAGAAFGSAKRWEIIYFVQVIQSCLAKGYHIFLFGSSFNDSSNTLILSALRNEDKNSINFTNLTDKTTLSQLLDSISTMDVFVSNDSGPMHIASALQVPLVAIFGPTNLYESAPYSAIRSQNRKNNIHNFKQSLETMSSEDSQSYIHISPFSTQNQILLHNPIPCAPCKQRECPLIHHNCMKSILPEEVITSIDRLLKNKGKL